MAEEALAEEIKGFDAILAKYPGQKTDEIAMDRRAYELWEQLARDSGEDVISLTGGLFIPKQWRNEVGQLRMDAPYCERDFKRPQLRAPFDENIRELVVKQGDTWHGFTIDDSPFDLVGWDGAVYPWAFPILAFFAFVILGALAWAVWRGQFDGVDAEGERILRGD